MPRTSTQEQTALYEAALEGLELQRQRLEAQIRSVRSMLGVRAPRTAAPAAAEPAEPAARKTGRKRRRRNLSPEARKRIAEAQRKRWAAYRKESGDK